MTILEHLRMEWDEPFLDVTAALRRWGYTHGSEHFPEYEQWEARNPWNIPGPLYVGDDDVCGMGSLVAPNNVCLHGPQGEFVFRQPSTEYELRQLVDAAFRNPVSAYALDGDAHWTPEAVAAWWESMQPVRRQLRETLDAVDNKRPDEAVRRWLDYLDTGAERYLQRYVAFLRARTG
jgi:hypothetical protein